MNRRTAGLACGLAAPLVALLAIVAATTLDPGFAWLESALSDTGALPAGRTVSLSLFADRPQFLAFNGGLVLSGALGLPFAGVLYADARNRLERAGAVVYGLAALSLAGVGVFFLPRPPHGAVAIGHYLATTLCFAVYGVGAARAGDRRFGQVTATLAPLHLLGWTVWAVALADGPVPGLAVPETFGALLFGGWSFVVAAWKLRADAREQRRGDD